MGAGDFGAGDGPAGEDPVAAPSPASANTPPAAPYLDLGLRNYLLNADGTTAAMHPVDQAAQWSFAVVRGTHKADPRVGHTFFSCPPGLSGAAKLNEMTLRAQDAFPFSRLIKAGQIAFEGVQIADPKKGETGIAVLYRNLVLDPLQTQTATVK
jgi:hypothetical protein